MALKTGAVFLDLTAAYDTIWHTGLLSNCPSACLSGAFRQWNCCYETAVSIWVHMGEDVSSWRRQANGLPQGSVLSDIVQPVGLYQ